MATSQDSGQCVSMHDTQSQGVSGPPCDYCGVPFEPKVSWQKYCGKTCHDEANKEKKREDNAIRVITEMQADRAALRLEVARLRRRIEELENV